MSDESRTEAEGFDQTNGLVDGLEGESDGTADGDLDSAAEATPRPVGAQNTFRDDWYGDGDGRDQNP